MDSLIVKEYQKIVDIVHGDGEVEEDLNLKTFTVRLPLSLIEELENYASFVSMKRTELARMILLQGVEELKDSFGLKVEKIGISFEDQYAMELGEKTFEEVLRLRREKKKEEEMTND